MIMSFAHHEPSPASAKKLYVKPYLQVYGDLGQMTNSVSGKGNRDGNTKSVTNIYTHA